MKSIIKELDSAGYLKRYVCPMQGHYTELSRNADTYTPATTAKMAPSNRGYCLKTNDGANDYILGTNNTGITGTSDRTLIFFGKFTRPTLTTVAGHNYPAFFGATSSKAGMLIGVNASSYLCSDFYSYSLSSTTAVNYGEEIVLSATLETSGTVSNLYKNGILIKNNIGLTGVNTTNGVLVVGRLATTYKSCADIYAVLLISKALTVSEETEITAELYSMRARSAPFSKAYLLPKTLRNGTNLLMSLNMKPNNGKIVDEVSGNTGTIPTSGVSFNSAYNLNPITFNSTTSSILVAGDSTAGAKTYSFLFKSTQTATADYIFNHGANAVGCFLINNSNKPLVYMGANNFRYFADQPWQDDGVLHHVVVQITGSAQTDINNSALYVDGVSQTASTTDATGAFAAWTSSLKLGGIVTGTKLADYSIDKLEVYNEVKSAQWIANKYASLKKTIQFKTDFGATQSTLTAGEGGTIGQFLSNTPFRFGDATARYQVSTSTINNKLVKTIKCITAGAIYLDTSQYCTPKENAYGAYEFWANKSGDGNTLTVELFSDLTTGYSNGYQFRFTTSEAAAIVRYQATAANTKCASAAALYPINTWHKITIKRNYAGTGTLYINDALVSVTGGSGANPWTAAEITSGRYFVLDFDALDQIAYSCPSGCYSITKSLMP